MVGTFDRRAFIKLAGGAIGAASVMGVMPPAHGQALDAIRQRGRIRVGYFQAPPVSFTDASGTLKGTSIDLLKRIVEQNGLGEIEPVLLEFDGLIPGLVADRFDVIACSLAVRPERCGVVDYSRPEVIVTPALAVRRGNPLALKSFEDIVANPAVRLGGISQTSEVGTAMAAGVPQSQLTLFPNDDAMISALAAERVDAAVSVGTLLPTILERNSGADVEMVSGFAVPVINGKEAISPGAYGFRKGVSDDLIAVFDAGINDALRSGWRLENFALYGLGAESLPGPDMTAAQFCAA